MNEYHAHIQTILEECKKHLQRINYAYNELRPLMPFSAEIFIKMSEPQLAAMDQYIFRFSKLQDTVGQKLFKNILLFLGEEVYNKSFIDIFNRLEQLGVVENYDEWNRLRIVRNEISHEYDENKNELAEKMNSLLDSKESLETYLYDVFIFLKSRGNFLQFSF
jgi:hypothetical protein